MKSSGYYRFPTIHDNTIVFVSEDDLWEVEATGGTARRITSGLGAALYPSLSPDGKWLAFSGREEGQLEVYLMPVDGGHPRRLTFTGGTSMVRGWTPDGEIVFASNFRSPLARIYTLFAVDPVSGEPHELPLGPAQSISYGPGGRSVVGRYGMVTREPAHWKRYRGGTAGDIWIDAVGRGEFVRLLKVDGNPTDPHWIGDRIYFASDHEGIANIYSCATDGKDLTRHTNHSDYYVRHPATDGKSIVYHAGADLYVLDPATGNSRMVEIDYRGPRTQRSRKFAKPERYLEVYEPHPKGHKLALTVRGRPYIMGNWEGAVIRPAESGKTRHRLTCWLHDGEHIVTVTDSGEEEHLVVREADGNAPPVPLEALDIGRTDAMAASPVANKVALVNHRNELLLVDLDKKKLTVLDRSEHSRIAGFDWSSDGRWIAYGFSPRSHAMIIKIADATNGELHEVTSPVLADHSPVFDPEGKFLYFISEREFNPVYDTLHFDLGFPMGSRPYLVTLRKDVTSPFLPAPTPLSEPKPQAAEGKKEEKESTDKSPSPVEIDFEGIERRILAFPVPIGRYVQIDAIPGKVLFTSVPVEGSLDHEFGPSGEPKAKAKLEQYDFKTNASEVMVAAVSSFKVSSDRSTLVYRAGPKLRAVKAGEKPSDAPDQQSPGRKSGYIDLNRVRAEVVPPDEWGQMFREIWRLQREQFWTEDMSKVDWEAVYQRYLPLLDRVTTRGEFSDLMWEMQGELGTSHAYEIGGDYRPEPRYRQGKIGADFLYDEGVGAWKIKHIVSGDPWEEEASAPLALPGVNAEAGQTILSVDGAVLSRELSPGAALVNKAGSEVQLSLGDTAGKSPRFVTVKALADDRSARYREWVEQNRAKVHEATKGRVGYVHVPDMGPPGYAEFHRYFLSEIDRDGLVVDVRYNSGGHVSALLLEKLARRRIGYVKTRWFGVEPWPEDSPPPALVALTNEYAGSDGDIFCHCFKLMKLGPLVGKRTWGGVIGIHPRHMLIDSGVTTQPEFSFWFVDVGWGVENYGTDPDIEVEIAPQEFGAGEDPQLDRAVDEVTRILKERPPFRPEMEPRPALPLPRMPG